DQVARGVEPVAQPGLAGQSHRRPQCGGDRVDRGPERGGRGRHLRIQGLQWRRHHHHQGGPTGSSARPSRAARRRVPSRHDAGRLNIGNDPSGVWRGNVNTYPIHSVASRSITNNDNSNTSFYIVLPFIPNFYDLRRPPDGTYPPDPFISNGNNPLQTAALMKNDEGVWRILSSVDSTFRLWRTDEQQLN